MLMQLEQSYLSTNETLKLFGEEENIDYVSAYDNSESQPDDRSISRNENNSVDLDCDEITASSSSLKNVTNFGENMDSETDYEEQFKRKASPDQVVSASERPTKRSKSISTHELPPAPMTPLPRCEDDDSDDFLRRLRANSKTKKDRRDYFAALPDEVVLMIFGNCSKPTLVNCACVCRRWNEIALDTDLWPRIDLSQRKISPGIMSHVLTRKPIVLRMSQTEVISPIFTTSLMSYSMANFSCKIEYLDLSMAVINPRDLELLLKTCHSLVKLSLENCEVDDNICDEIAKNVKLTVLNLSQCVGLTDVGVRSFLKNCRNLIELNIAWTSLDAGAIKSVCQFVPRDILKLNFSGGVKAMTDAHISVLVMRCGKLRELDLSDATGITGTSVKAICENSENLRILSLSRCYNIHPTNYAKLFELPFLTHLNIFGLFSEAQIEQLRKSYRIGVNQMKFSHIARPTVGERRTSIWCMATKD